MNFDTERYRFEITELEKGGPGGYESTYLTSEGFPVSDGLYDIFAGFDGDFLAADTRALRHRNGETLVEALESESKVGIASGFKPSGAYHFGHKLTSGTVAFLQRNGAQVFVPVADIESEMDNKISREQYRFWAADNLMDWGANGVDLDAAHVYLQSEEYRVNALSYMVARGMLFQTAVDIYGADKMVDEFPFLFAGVTQVGDILLPQHADFGNDHSFMVSGQDQDGHMKMSISLTDSALTNGHNFLGISTNPSGLYIPHMRGITGKKASSSEADSTVYLGQGPHFEDIETRISRSVKKIDDSLPEQLAVFSLDMVRYMAEFNAQGEVDFTELTSEPAYKALVQNLEASTTSAGAESAVADIDKFLIENCKDLRQVNEDIVRETLPDFLKAHQKRREDVLRYALKLAAGDADATSVRPDFWSTPDGARVNPTDSKQSRWYDIVAGSSDRLIP